MVPFLIPCVMLVVLLALMLPQTLHEAAEQKAANPTTAELDSLLGFTPADEVAPEDQPDFVDFADAWVQDRLAARKA